jgi:ABC-type transport system substrate-binding protein
MAAFTPRERLALVKNASYWNKDRVPKVDKMVLLPMPEANARTAALLSGQVDWVEAPAPDALPELKQRGFKLYANEQPHVWPWQFSRVEGSPWNDIRVRKAANLCVDREGLKDGLLAGLMVPATGTFEPGHPWRGKPTFEIMYDKVDAQKLMQEAGFGPNKKLTVKTQTSASARNASPDEAFSRGLASETPRGKRSHLRLADTGICGHLAHGAQGSRTGTMGHSAVAGVERVRVTFADGMPAVENL